MINIKKNILNKKIIIPEATKPVANYSPFTISGNLVFISGQVPIVDGKVAFTGKVGHDLTVHNGIEASRICMLNTFGIINLALDNKLELLRKCIKITVFVNSDKSFVEQPIIANGASNLIKEILYPEGNHARSAVSVNSLPLNSAIEIESIFEIAIEN